GGNAEKGAAKANGPRGANRSFLSFPKPTLEVPPAGIPLNHPPISNPARTNNVPNRKHGSRCYRRAVLIPAFRNPYSPSVAVSNLRRNLEALFCPRLKISARKFGELAPPKLLTVSEC